MTLRHPAIGPLLGSARPRCGDKTTRMIRYASSEAAKPSNRARNFLYGTGTLLAVSLGYFYLTDTRASVHQYLVPPLIRKLFPDAEDAHHFGTAALKELYTLGLHPRERGSNSESNSNKLAVEVFGEILSSPVGISGGLDKGAEIPDALFAIGSGVVEIGGVTPLPQPGNPRPRVFRVASQDAIVNRYGLNSEGADVVAIRLRQRVREFAYQHGFGIDEIAEEIVLNGGAGVPPGSLIPGRLLAVQIAKNKLTPDNDLDAVVQDHVACVEKLAKYADIITVNVSSPNTPGLRSLQSKEPLTRILSAVVESANSIDRKTKPMVMVKVSPDEDSDSQIRSICDAVWESGVAGVIVGNTTLKRPDPIPSGYLLPPKDAQALLETGGYSGPQLFDKTKQLVAKYRKALDDGPSEDPSSLPKGAPVMTPSQTDAPSVFDPAMSPSEPDAGLLQPQSDRSTLTGRSKALSSPPKVIFASGGITNGEQALEVLNAGASVAMCYTAVVYGGVGTISRIKEEMKEKISGNR
ncbi:dihydroorotate dehydrogenase (fumarate) [Verruconis gallopava]|uniref:Dihydroorotate dehydrogenase (quinone), mitochondrial n=1 Tax=Verruconis gallopava TaxID=253628 RepID=A0A0D2A914_9PEZI|nr:dihydroorotate dehydrogenase (fumarate) [Verruconis gallopava]KIW03258.1 dihydroorotate dehydrogenase (fumarate) [Verruconis gallopava]